MIKFSYLKLFVSLLLVVIYFFFPQVGFPDDGLLGHLLYSLCHANVFHLLANVVCLWLIACDLRLYYSYPIAVLCSFLPCFVGEVTVGFSGVLFAMVGISWGDVGRFKEMVWRNKWFLLIPLFIPHVNGLLHIYCMFFGWLLGWMRTSSR